MINQRITPFQAIQAQNSRLQRVSSKRHNPFIFIVLAAALLVSLTQVGCTGLTSANATAPADPTTATTVAVAGATGLFGSVGTGSSATQTFTVTNTGAATLTITQLAASGSGFSVNGFTLPITVNPGQGTSFVAKFAPTTAGAVTGSISMTANTNPAVSTIALSGTGTSSGQPSISIQPTAVSFGGVGLGQNVGQAVSITNVGSGVLTISNISVAGAGFSVVGVSGPITLTAGQATTIVADINTMTVGNISGSITLSNNSSTPSVVIPLSGAGMSAQSQPAITVNPTSVNFGGVAVGQSVGQAMSITNSGSGTLTVSNVAATGSGFSITGATLPISLTAGQAANFVARMTPAAAGSVTGSLTITNNSSTPSVVVPLSGAGTAQGQPAITVNPTSVSFGNVTVGAPNSQAILIQNNGTASLTISQATASGTGFSISGLATPATIAGGSSTTFNVAFAPTSGGAVSGSVSLVNNAAGSPLTIPLSGTGVVPSFLLGASASSLTFPSVAVGSNSSQSVTLTNSGNSTVTIGTVSATGAGFSASGVAAGQMIGAGQTATLGVTFTPGSAATVSGTVTVTSNATNSPINISLSGTGMQAVAHSVSLSWTASTSTVVGYNVYRSTVSGGPYTLITSSNVPGTTYTDTGVQAGVTYFYVVTAVDSNGNESAFSNEASVTVPTP
jgi:Abnormal spindle-like microcephaly-assoc'd, ASPM-SPD-2-Hydin/Fibronectin type III domain